MNHRQLGVDLYNETWRLMESRGDDELVLHMAHASAYHWRQAPECKPKNRARSEWLCSRVYTVLGRAEPALYHAKRCLEICRADPESMEDWDLPFAHEALARAYRVAGNDVEVRDQEQRARELGEQLADPEDREHLEEALATL